MALKEELVGDIKSILRTNWQARDGYVVPDPASVRLGNDAIKISAAVLYADLAESTGLVNGYRPQFAAEVYKIYLHCASKLIRAEGGEITAFDGDRVMGVFLGENKENAATRCALKINSVVIDEINPQIKTFWDTTYTLRHGVGVDASDLFVARTGIRGSNDLVWIGRAANYAAKLCALREENYASWITESVYNKLDIQTRATGGRAMWEQRSWTAQGKAIVYRSNWKWGV